MTDAVPSSSHNLQTPWKTLVDAGRPDLYRLNAFRVTGLPTDANARDISRQAEKIKMMQKLGCKADQSRGALPLQPPPDSYAIREAVQRLHDPERRLIDEFFWFWPHQLGQSKTDEALTALAQGNATMAAATWVKQERCHSESDVSTHNLAVLVHLLALDLEHAALSEPHSQSQARERDNFWRDAFRRWRILLEHEGFWSRLTARIRDLDDPRLTTGTARRMRHSLPLALLCINAQLAVRAAEQGNTDEAERHMGIIRDSGFEPHVAEESARISVQPVRERIKTLCEAAEKEADGDPEHANAVATRLLDQTRSGLTILDCLLAAGNSGHDAAHDEVALCALGGLIAFVNKTGDWKTFLKVLKLILPVAASASARGRIQDNIKIAESNFQYQSVYGTCWFCRQCLPDAAAAEVVMHGDVERVPSSLGTQVHWRRITVKVPRCTICKTAHNNVGILSVVGGVLGGIVGAIKCAGIMEAHEGEKIGGLFILAALAAVGYGIGYAIGCAFWLKGTKRKSAKKNFPEVRRLMEQGWAIGGKPSGVQ